MKRLMMILALIMIVVGVNAQSIWKPLPSDYFTSKANYKQMLKAGTLKGEFIVRWQAGVVATSYGKNKETGKLETVPFSAVGVGLGYQHLSPNIDGTFYYDYGANLLLIKNAQANGMGLGLYVNYSLVNIGSHYDFDLKQFFFDTGVQLHF